MSGDVWAHAAFLALALVLPVAALRGSRIPATAAVKMTSAWLAIFVIAALVFSSLMG